MSSGDGGPGEQTGVSVEKTLREVKVYFLEGGGFQRNGSLVNIVVSGVGLISGADHCV